MDSLAIKNVLEAALLAAGDPLPMDRLLALFPETERPERAELTEALDALRADCTQRPVDLTETASGWRLVVRGQYAPYLARLWEEKPARYSRALLETLALIAYRQPITRGEIEDIRGVAVGANIVKTLLEREWVRVVGHRDVPGRPAMYGTTRQFLDYFNLKTLAELPSLTELRDFDQIAPELPFDAPAHEPQTTASPATEQQDAGPQAGAEDREAGQTPEGGAEAVPEGMAAEGQAREN
jgi:segregation and condensation protein B